MVYTCGHGHELGFFHLITTETKVKVRRRIEVVKYREIDVYTVSIYSPFGAAFRVAGRDMMTRFVVDENTTL